MKYGKITILKEAPPTFYKKIKRRNVKCECDCGVIKIISLGSLKSGLTKSCGCLGKERRLKASTKHGYATKGISSIYRRWYGMIDRCHNPKNFSFNYYGGRGIKVCKRWRESIKNFVEDMGIAPKAKTLDRIDNNGNYCKKNCRWATSKEQRKNQRSNRNTTFIKFEGKNLSIKEWAKEKNIKYGTLYNRIYIWKIPPQEALKKINRIPFKRKLKP